MTLVQILLIAVAVIYVIGSRFAGQPLRARSLLAPVAFTVWGITGLRGAHLGLVDIAFLLVSLLVGLGAGAARGVTIHIYPRDGVLWQRYRPATLGVWVLLIAVRIGLMAAGHALGASIASGQTMALTFGVSLIAETLIVGRRALATGVPMAPSRRRSRVGSAYYR